MGKKMNANSTPPLRSYDPSNAGFTAQYGAPIHNQSLLQLRSSLVSGSNNGLENQTMSPLKGENDDLRRQYYAVRSALGQMASINPPSQFDHMGLQAENVELRAKLAAAQAVLNGNY